LQAYASHWNDAYDSRLCNHIHHPKSAIDPNGDKVDGRTAMSKKQEQEFARGDVDQACMYRDEVEEVHLQLLRHGEPMSWWHEDVETAHPKKMIDIEQLLLETVTFPNVNCMRQPQDEKGMEGTVKVGQETLRNSIHVEMGVHNKVKLGQELVEEEVHQQLRLQEGLALGQDLCFIQANKQGESEGTTEISISDVEEVETDGEAERYETLMKSQVMSIEKETQGLNKDRSPQNEEKSLQKGQLVKIEAVEVSQLQNGRGRKQTSREIYDKLTKMEEELWQGIVALKGGILDAAKVLSDAVGGFQDLENKCKECTHSRNQSHDLLSRKVVEKGFEDSTKMEEPMIVEFVKGKMSKEEKQKQKLKLHHEARIQEDMGREAFVWNESLKEFQLQVLRSKAEVLEMTVEDAQNFKDTRGQNICLQEASTTECQQSVLDTTTEDGQSHNAGILSQKSLRKDKALANLEDKGKGLVVSEQKTDKELTLHTLDPLANEGTSDPEVSYSAVMTIKMLDRTDEMFLKEEPLQGAESQGIGQERGYMIQKAQEIRKRQELFKTKELPEMEGQQGNAIMVLIHKQEGSETREERHLVQQMVSRLIKEDYGEKVEGTSSGGDEYREKILRREAQGESIKLQENGLVILGIARETSEWESMSSHKSTTKVHMEKVKMTKMFDNESNDEVRLAKERSCFSKKDTWKESGELDDASNRGDRYLGPQGSVDFLGKEDLGQNLKLATMKVIDKTVVMIEKFVEISINKLLRKSIHEEVTKSLDVGRTEPWNERVEETIKTRDPSLHQELPRHRHEEVAEREEVRSQRREGLLQKGKEVQMREEAAFVHQLVYKRIEEEFGENSSSVECSSREQSLRKRVEKEELKIGLVVLTQKVGERSKGDGEFFAQGYAREKLQEESRSPQGLTTEMQTQKVESTKSIDSAALEEGVSRRWVCHEVRQSQERIRSSWKEKWKETAEFEDASISGEQCVSQQLSMALAGRDTEVRQNLRLANTEVANKAVLWIGNVVETSRNEFSMEGIQKELRKSEDTCKTGAWNGKILETKNIEDSSLSQAVSRQWVKVTGKEEERRQRTDFLSKDAMEVIKVLRESVEKSTRNTLVLCEQLPAWRAKSSWKAANRQKVGDEEEGVQGQIQAIVTLTMSFCLCYCLHYHD
jgi:hypothetical protein